MANGSKEFLSLDSRVGAMNNLDVIRIAISEIEWLFVGWQSGAMSGLQARASFCRQSCSFSRRGLTSASSLGFVATMLRHHQPMHSVRPDFRARDRVSLAIVIQRIVKDPGFFNQLHETLPPGAGDTIARRLTLYNEIETVVTI